MSALPPPQRAVVVGASLAGLFAARALSKTFEEVVLVERDELPEAPSTRRGVGQAHHSHVLLHGGIEAIDELMPGLRAALERDGPGISDAARDMRWYLDGAWKPRFRSGVQMMWCERARLEWHVRQRLERRGHVEIRAGHRLVDFLTRHGGAQIRGVRIAAGRDAPVEELEADLVVDASGRGSRTPTLLAELGYSEPPTSTCEVDLGYTSCKFERPDDYDGSWKTLAIYPEPPHTKRLGVLYPLDERRFHVTLGGWCGEHAPSDLEGFLDFAAGLGRPDLYEYIRDAEPLTRIRVFKVPAAIWRHYDRMEQWPGGLIVAGDALCNFNPVYGQGMTVCAREARLLARLLDDPSRPPVASEDFARAFHRGAGRIIAVPWLLATSQDMRFEGVGEASLPYRLLDWYTAQIMALAEDHPRIHRDFLRVLTLESHPLRLAAPSTVAAVLGRVVGGQALRPS